METTVQRLADEAAIRNVHIRYCRGIDRMDWDLVRSCYHPDAIDDHGYCKGDVEGFIAWASESLAPYESTTHFTGNQLVEVNGDTAWAEHYVRAFHRRPAGDTHPDVDLVVNVRYIDRMERRDGAWRISERVITIDSEREDPVGPLWVLPVLRRSTRDRSDPSYHGFPGL